MKNFKPFVIFCARVSLLQFATYFVSGILFATLFRYEQIWEQPVISSYLKPFSSNWVKAGPLFQFGRGLVIAFMLWFIIEYFHSGRYGWLKLWGVFVIIGIVATPMSSPGSMEGIVYSQLPLWFHFIMLPEVLLQTLCFSWLVIRFDKKRYVTQNQPT